ncbi:hypothetical protein CTI12_AA470070 [Artemisia annua]|uniref:Uncharacterized protein n=1 Tax=Artemisia annua TaxID=35608 RepID=A0A2U1LNT0_ARTAN|nr:hypothetical protein CTI12_AA470070 [Artemisia annua]
MYNHVDKDQKPGNQTLQTQREYLDYQGMSMTKRMTNKEVEAKMVCRVQPAEKKREASWLARRASRSRLSIRGYPERRRLFCAYE